MMELVKELRARTHLGLTECKKALEKSGGDLEKAIEILQKKGLKKVDNLVVPTEGIVRAATLVSGGEGFIVEINCQTDFGAKSEIFQKFVKDLLIKANTSRSIKVGDSEQTALISNQLGEKVTIRRAAWLERSSEYSVITSYNHMDKIAVLLEASIPEQYDPSNEEKADEFERVLDLLENLAMQIVANKPLALDRFHLPTDLVEKKQAFYLEEVKNKPEQVQQKILTGKMEKWYSEVSFLDQECIFLSEGAPKKKVSDLLKEVAPEVKLVQFIRYERGEQYAC